MAGIMPACCPVVCLVGYLVCKLNKGSVGAHHVAGLDEDALVRFPQFSFIFA